MECSRLPAGDAELRKLAVDTVRRALLEAGHEIGEAAAVLEYDGSAPSRACARSATRPMHRVGALWICAGGRCAPAWLNKT